MPRRGDLRDAAGVDQRQLHMLADLRHLGKPRGERGPHAGDVFGQRVMAFDVPEVHRHVVDEARLGHHLRGLYAFAEAEALGEVLVGAKADTEHEIVSDCVANLFEQFEREAHAVLERAAVFVGTKVGGRRLELFRQMAVGEDFRAVELASLAADGSGRIGGDDAPDVMLVHLAREGAVGGFTHGRGCHDGKPVAGVPGGAPAQMRDLADDPAIMLVDALRELLEIGDDRVVAHIDLPEHRRRIGRHEGGAAEHRHADAALRLLLVIELVAELGLAVLGIGGGMRRAHHPVLERQVPDPERLEERVLGRDGRIHEITGHAGSFIEVSSLET